MILLRVSPFMTRVFPAIQVIKVEPKVANLPVIPSILVCEQNGGPRMDHHNPKCIILVPYNHQPVIIDYNIYIYIPSGYLT